MDFLDLLQGNKLITGDAAMGSQLIARGLPTDVPAEKWNLDSPDTVQEIQKRYVAAGSQQITTNTFGGNPISLTRHGLERQTDEINEAGVRNAREVAGDDVVIVGDMGPCGELIQPLGALSAEDARSSFYHQAQTLERAGVDAILAETFESSSELRLAVQGAQEATDLPILASMKFNAQDDGQYRSVMGDAPADLVELAEELNITVVGTNCGQSIKSMVGLVERLAKLTDLPIIAQPNAGRPRLEEGETVYDEDSDAFAQHLPALQNAGATIIGGCCGTTSEYVRAIRELADSLTS